MISQWIIIQGKQTNQLWKASTIGEPNPYGLSQLFDKPLRKQHINLANNRVPKYLASKHHVIK